MKKLLAAALLAAMACGCVSVRRNDGGEANLRPNVLKEGLVEKYSVGAPVQATDEVQCLFGFICWGSSATHHADQAEFSGFGAAAKAKNGAYANACDAAKCDHIVGTRYTVTKDDYFVYSKTKAEITGYPVTLTGVEVLPPPPAGCPCK